MQAEDSAELTHVVPAGKAVSATVRYTRGTEIRQCYLYFKLGTHGNLQDHSLPFFKLPPGLKFSTKPPASSLMADPNAEQEDRSGIGPDRSTFWLIGNEVMASFSPSPGGDLEAWEGAETIGLSILGDRDRAGMW